MSTMKKIALMFTAAGIVLTTGIFSNIGLFGINALAVEPTIDQKITTIFRRVISSEFGLKEIKNELQAIELKLDNLISTLQDLPDTRVKHLEDDIEGNAAGWNHDGSTALFFIQDADVGNNPVVVIFDL